MEHIKHEMSNIWETKTYEMKNLVFENLQGRLLWSICALNFLSLLHMLKKLKTCVGKLTC